MDIIYRDVPEKIYDLIAEKQKDLKKEKQRHVSQSAVLTILLKDAYLEPEKKGQ